MAHTLADRLRSRTRQMGLNAAQLAALAGVNRSFVYDILRGRSAHPRLETLQQVADVLRCDTGWLLHGAGDVEGESPFVEDPDETFVAIPHAGARVSMGGGMTDEEAPPGRNYHFRRAWIRNTLKAPPSMLRILHVEGDSMAPTLLDGDTVLVDMSRTAPNPPGIFVVHDGMGLVAKRLEHVPNSDPARVRIISDNPLYTPYEGVAGEINILGRIRWFAREV